MSDNNLRDWTVMVYFAADNDLQDEAFNNLSQMVEAGGTKEVHVLAQIHARDPQIPTRRYFMRGNDNAVADEVSGATNTGSVEDLIDFVKWGSEEHRAHNYLFVLWGHGNGIFDDEDDIGTAKLKQARRVQATKGMPYVSLTPGAGTPDGDAAADTALTSFELKEAFKRIQEVLGKKVAILGMDACLMSMAEIAQQVNGNVELMVASEEVVPDKSWPYDRILQRLTRKTGESLTPEELAKVIVEEYVACYESGDQPVTLSACRLERTADLAEALDELGRALGQLLKKKGLTRAVSKARRNTQMFQFRDYVDLYDFCEVLKKTLVEERFRYACEEAAPICKTAKEACDKVMQVMGRKGGDESGFVLHSRNTSGNTGLLERANGVSIYFPPLPSTYAELDLSEYTHWNNFLHEYMNAVFRPNRVKQTPKRMPVASPVRPESILVPKLGADEIAETTTVSSKLKARLLLPEGTFIHDLLTPFKRILATQAFLMMGESAEIKVPAGTELNLPKKGSVKVKASSGTSVKASSGTSLKASSGTSVKDIGSEDGTLKIGWLDVPACTLHMSFSGEEPEDLRNGTKIYPPKGKDGTDGEPIIVINDVKFVGVDVEDKTKAAGGGWYP